MAGGNLTTGGTRMSHADRMAARSRKANGPIARHNATRVVDKKKKQTGAGARLVAVPILVAGESPSLSSCHERTASPGSFGGDIMPSVTSRSGAAPRSASARGAAHRHSPSPRTFMTCPTKDQERRPARCTPKETSAPQDVRRGHVRARRVPRGRNRRGMAAPSSLGGRRRSRSFPPPGLLDRM